MSGRATQLNRKTPDGEPERMSKLTDISIELQQKVNTDLYASGVMC
jgi:hypothetical protein